MEEIFERNRAQFLQKYITLMFREVYHINKDDQIIYLKYMIEKPEINRTPQTPEKINANNLNRRVN